MRDIGERFELRERIGGSATSDVYRALDRTRGHDVALRLVRADVAGEDYVERVRREAEAASDIRHDNVVRTLDHGVIDGNLFVARELVRGTTLEDVIARRGHLPEDEARRIAEQIARGLEAAHARGVLHRDLNVGNVFITPDGTAKIVDFGMPSVPRHPSPEQSEGRTIDERADVYGLGVVLQQMLTGLPRKGSRRRMRRISKEMEAVVLRALESDLDRRYPSAAAMAEALRPHTVSPPVAAPAPTHIAQRRQPVAPPIVPPSRAARLVPLDPTERIVPPPSRIARPAPPPRGRRGLLAAVLLALLAIPLGVAMFVGALTVDGPREADTAVLSATTTPVATATPQPSVEPTPVATLIPPVETTPEPTPAPVATPAPPPPVVAPPPQAPAPVVAVPPDSAAATVRSFYELVQQKRYDEAAALWSPRMKANYPPSTNIYGRFDRTRQIVIRSISPVATNSGGATVAIDILEVLDSGVTRRWVGTWLLVWDGTRWLMDAPSLRAG